MTQTNNHKVAIVSTSRYATDKTATHIEFEMIDMSLNALREVVV